MSRLERYWNSSLGATVFTARAGVPRYVHAAERKRAVGEEIRGYATRWNKVHHYKGGFDVFLPGCFARSLVSGKAIRFLVDHEEAKLLATSVDALEVLGDDLGLAFRCDLSRIDRGLIGDRRGMSVAYNPLVTENKQVAGHSVRVIKDADLQEISVCRRGVVEEAFALIAPSSRGTPLRDMCGSGRLVYDGAAEKVSAALRNLAASFASA